MSSVIFYPIEKFFIDRIDNKPIVEQFRRLSEDLTPQPQPRKPNGGPNPKPIKICLLNRAESQPTTPTTPSAPFGGGHPLAMLTGSGVPAGGTQQSSSNQATPVASRRDVPPSPDTIRGSKTFMRLNKELDQREKQEFFEKNDRIRALRTPVQASKFVRCPSSSSPRTSRTEVNFLKNKNKTTPMGFEPTRAEHIGLAVQRLNHSATVSYGNNAGFKNYI